MKAIRWNQTEKVDDVWLFYSPLSICFYLTPKGPNGVRLHCTSSALPLHLAQASVLCYFPRKSYKPTSFSGVIFSSNRLLTSSKRTRWSKGRNIASSSSATKPIFLKTSSPQIATLSSPLPLANLVRPLLFSFPPRLLPDAKEMTIFRQYFEGETRSASSRAASEAVLSQNVGQGSQLLAESSFKFDDRTKPKPPQAAPKKPLSIVKTSPAGTGGRKSLALAVDYAPSPSRRLPLSSTPARDVTAPALSKESVSPVLRSQGTEPPPSLLPQPSPAPARPSVPPTPAKKAAPTPLPPSPVPPSPQSGRNETSVSAIPTPAKKVLLHASSPSLPSSPHSRTPRRSSQPQPSRIPKAVPSSPSATRPRRRSSNRSG